MAKTATKKNTTKKSKAEPGKVIEPETGTLASYLEQWNKFGEKKKGKAREKELDTLLEVAQEDLSEAEFAELEQAIAPERVEKRENQKPRAKKGEGLSRAEWRASKFEEAAAAGIWYPGHEDGCIICGQTDRKHYSGGQCTRCYTIARNKRLGIDKEREAKRKEREEKKAALAKVAAEKKAAREKEKLEAKRAKEKAAAEKKKKENEKGNLTKQMDEKKKAEIAEESKRMAKEAAEKEAAKKKAEVKKDENPKAKAADKKTKAKAS